MKFRFTLTAGLLVRGQVRTMIQNSIDKLNYAYEDASCSFHEDKGWTESTFYVQGTNLPDSAEPEIQAWIAKLQVLTQVNTED